MYAIKVLTSIIDEHLSEIKKLKNLECDSMQDNIFKDSEIIERKQYVEQLQQAIEKLL